MALLGAQFVNAVSPNPVGSLQAYAGASAPTGWLLCNGTSYTTAAYPELYSVLGYTYGGSGANFNVPDLRGRVPMGAGTGAGLNASGTGAPTGTAQTARTRGQWGGEETHLLSTSEMPSHSHGGTTGNDSPDHAHATGNGQGFATHISGSASTQAGSGAPTINGVVTNTAGATARHAHSITAEGGGSRHNTVPPFIVTNYIIRAVADAPRSGLAYGSTPPIVTALPSNPQFGDVVTYIADATNGVAWNLQYDATGTYPWKFIGGAPLYAQGASSYAAITSTTYVDAGASMTLALAGDYNIRMDAQIQMPASNASVTYTSIATNSSAASDYVGPIAFANATPSVDHGGSKASRFTVAAGEIAKIRARVSTGTGYVGFTRLIATPVRVSA